mmetsp:Transcript_10152/g.24873  ORF Transcript_10152/g.24873 Transcript_10152/m.24873 type:complete len:307 (+) Transcript_10152:334-1254(+)
MDRGTAPARDRVEGERAVGRRRRDGAGVRPGKSRPDNARGEIGILDGRHCLPQIFREPRGRHRRGIIVAGSFRRAARAVVVGGEDPPSPSWRTSSPRAVGEARQPRAHEQEGPSVRGKYSVLRQLVGAVSGGGEHRQRQIIALHGQLRRRRQFFHGGGIGATVEQASHHLPLQAGRAGLRFLSGRRRILRTRVASLLLRGGRAIDVRVHRRGKMAEGRRLEGRRRAPGQRRAAVVGIVPPGGSAVEGVRGTVRGRAEIEKGHEEAAIIGERFRRVVGVELPVGEAQVRRIDRIESRRRPRHYGMEI